MLVRGGRPSVSSERREKGRLRVERRPRIATKRRQVGRFGAPVKRKDATVEMRQVAALKSCGMTKWRRPGCVLVRCFARVNSSRLTQMDSEWQLWNVAGELKAGTRHLRAYKVRRGRFVHATNLAEVLPVGARSCARDSETLWL